MADLPNERWQADMTHVALPNGEVFEVLNIIDDHSRLCVASRVMNVVKAHDVVRVLHKSAETWGYPASLLTDNGLIFTTRDPLRRRGCGRTRAVRPRHHGQALTALPPPDLRQGRAIPPDAQEVPGRPGGHRDQEATPAAIDHFVTYYNDVRPHRGVGRKTPAVGLRSPGEGRAIAVIRQGRRAAPAARQGGHSRPVTLRHEGASTTSASAVAYAGWRVAMLIDGLDIEVVGLDGSPLRRLVLDPTKDYQRMP